MPSNPLEQVAGRPLLGAEGASRGRALAAGRTISIALEAARPRRRLWPLSAALRALYIMGALFLFILALEVLKSGAGGVADVLGGVSAQGTLNMLGFGWLLVYLAMSGSPVAAIALTLFAGGVVSDNEAFAMLNGSRLGASFFVLFVGFLYYLGHRRTADGIFIGVVALITTFTIYLPVVPIGSFILDRGWLDGVEASAPGFVMDFKAYAYEPAVDAGRQHLPGLLLFVLGGALLLGSFAVFDRALPSLERPSLRMERIKNFLHHPLAMFLLGLLITTLTLSVAISLTLLIPLSVKGYLRRQGIIPYVMGANIATWVDTMVAALLLDSPRAFTIVFTQMTVGAVLSLLVLLFLYRPYSRAVLAVTARVAHSRKAFTLFVGCIFLVPLALFLW